MSLLRGRFSVASGNAGGSLAPCETRTRGLSQRTAARACVEARRSGGRVTVIAVSVSGEAPHWQSL